MEAQRLIGIRMIKSVVVFFSSSISVSLRLILYAAQSAFFEHDGRASDDVV